MKRFIQVLSIVFIMFLVTGCGSSETYSFTVITGDTVTIKVNTIIGHNMTQEVPFKVKKNNNLMLTGNFIYLNEYNERINSLDPDAETISVIEREKDEGNIIYTLYLAQVDGYESDYIYLIKIKNSNTGIILTSVANANKDDVVKAFEALTISSTKSE